MSSKARAILPDSVGGLTVMLVQPDRLVELVFEADRVLVYWRRSIPHGPSDRREVLGRVAAASADDRCAR